MAGAESLARGLGISHEAAEVYLSHDVIDLHVDSYIWYRLFGYDPRVRHPDRLLGGWLLGHCDLPRMRDANVGGAAWVITTSPLGTDQERLTALERNLRELSSLLGSAADRVRVVRTVGEYRAARALGDHGAFLAIQGGNALSADVTLLDRFPPGLLTLVTLVHLHSSEIGGTSAPWAADWGLADRGLELIRELEARRVLVDLAHLGRRGFFEAVAFHDRSLPLVVSHTGVMGADAHWRNLDDAQLVAIADSGGTIGILFHSLYLGAPLWGAQATDVVRHVEHVINTVGEDYVSIGSDFDGFIVPPVDLRSCRELPRLVELMLRRGHSPERIGKLLGGNFLRVLQAVRG